MKKFFYALFFGNLGVVLFFWINGSASLIGVNNLLVIARLLGLLAVNFVLLQFALIGRNLWLERAFGMDKLSRFHHDVGKYAIFLIVLHPIFITLAYAQTSQQGVINQFISLLTDYPDIINAFIAVILFCVIVVISLTIIRLKLKYETWYFVHLLTYAAILFAFGHQLKLGGDFISDAFVVYWYLLYSVVLGSFVIFRWLRPIFNFLRFQFRVEKIVKETHDTHSIYITGKNLEEFRRQSGQFFIFRFLDSARWWQAHPFSLSWGAANTKIRITPKSSGDFTSIIHLVKPGTPVFIDGPYGIFTQKVLRKNKVLFLAAGVGITPIRALIEEFSQTGKDMVLLYSNKLAKDIIFKDELEAFSKKSKMPVYHFFSEQAKLPLNGKGKYFIGRIDKQKLAELVKDITKRDIYLCGPSAFMDAMRDNLKQLGVDPQNIHFEKFSLT